MSDVFVFSTRYLGEGYAFSMQHDLDPTSRVREYLKSKLWCKFPSNYTYKEKQKEEEDLERVWVLYERHKKELKRFFNIKNIDFDDSLIDKNDLKSELKDKVYYDTFISFFETEKCVLDFEKELASCAGKTECEKFDSRFSYYTLKYGDQSDTIFAVPHLNWEPDLRWLQSLIDDFGTVLTQDDTLYLIMHDNDVPYYAHTPYKLLSEKEQKAIGFSMSRGKSSVIVFQHSSNDVVDLLKDQSITESQVRDRIISISTIQNILEIIFKDGLKDEDTTKKELCNIPVHCSLDLNDQDITEQDKLVFDDDGSTTLQSGRPFYTFTDNKGSLLNELMHVRMSISSARRFIRFVEKLKEPGLEQGNRDRGKKAVIDIHKISFPLIIKVYMSIFKDWADALLSDDDKIKTRIHRNKKAMEENLERVFSFFNNSSIWVRIIDIYDQDAYNRAIDEFNYFDSIGLYDYDSAWENLEYNTRSFADNYLFSTLDGHGNFVTPNLYGNEVEAKRILQGNNVLKH